MRKDLLHRRKSGADRLRAVDHAPDRKRPQLTRRQVEILHHIAWALGLGDVLLVAVTFLLS